MKLFEWMQFVIDHELLVAVLLAGAAILGNVVARGRASHYKTCDENTRTFCGAMLFGLSCLGTLIFVGIEVLSILTNLLGGILLAGMSSWVGNAAGASEAVAASLVCNLLSCIISIGGIIGSLLLGKRLRNR